MLPLASELGVSALVHLDATTSTMDEAHTRAMDGAPGGTLIVADYQTAGRGRGGNSWSSAQHAGVWMTLLERPAEASMLRVLSLRLGLTIATSLQPFCDDTVLVKWPNDLMTTRGKLGGILVEARWRERVVDWVAIGIGINLRVPTSLAGTTSLRRGTTRADVLRAIVPPMRRAVGGGGVLDASELAAWNARDFAVGRRILAPVAGTVQGIAADGALLVREECTVQDTPVHAGSMVFADSP